MLHNKAKLAEHNKSCLNSSTFASTPSIYFMKRQQLASLFYPIILISSCNQGKADDEVKEIEKSQKSKSIL
jgi:hypothetical protein